MNRHKATPDPEYVALLEAVAAVEPDGSDRMRQEYERLIPKLQDFQRRWDEREAARVAAIMRLPIATIDAPLARIDDAGRVTTDPVEPRPLSGGAGRDEPVTDTTSYTSTRAAARELLAQRAGRR